jgi:hypothetical protein
MAKARAPSACTSSVFGLVYLLPSVNFSSLSGHCPSNHAISVYMLYCMLSYYVVKTWGLSSKMFGAPQGIPKNRKAVQGLGIAEKVLSPHDPVILSINPTGLTTRRTEGSSSISCSPRLVTDHNSHMCLGKGFIHHGTIAQST